MSKQKPHVEKREKLHDHFTDLRASDGLRQADAICAMCGHRKALHERMRSVDDGIVLICPTATWSEA